MILSDISIKRPVFAMVLSLLLVAFGIVSFDRLSLREYPNIDAPIVTVEVNYLGAPANVVETRITNIIEERLAGIEGVEYIESSSQDGRSTVTIEFSIDRDIGDAANDVRDRIAGVRGDLPDQADPPEVQKVDSNEDVVIWQNLNSTKMTVPELTDYAERYLVDQYSTLNGVARVRIGGGQRYAIRVWLDRSKMAARNLGINDIENALRSENIEFPAGSLESNSRMFKARVNRSFKKPDDFNNLVLKEGNDGYLIKLGDVARIELGLEESRNLFRGNGVPMVGIGIIKQSTANTITVARETKKLTKKLNKDLPNGMHIGQSYDTSIFIERSVHEVYITFFIAIACVVFVIYAFLGNIRATIIPAITVPISIVATFIVIYYLGFSINLLTLLALVLAIGLVVDDAIVVVENIVRRIEEYGETPLVAAYRGTREVGFAVISTTLVLVSVFVPIIFLEGILGRLFTEFALTISAAVGFSALIALTLCAMMSSQILKHKNSKNSKIVDLVNRVFAKLNSHYISIVKRTIEKPLIVIFVFFITVIITAILYTQIPEEFTPTEDRGAFFVMVTGPEGSTYKYMKEYMEIIEKRLMKYVDSGEVKRLIVRAPNSFGNAESFSGGMVIGVMDEWGKRRPANEILNEIRINLSDLPGVRAIPIMRQGLGGGGGFTKPIQFVLGGATYEELVEWRDIIFDKIAENNPGFDGLDSNYKETRPQLDFSVNYERAAKLGVTISEIGNTLQTMMGGKRVTTYLKDGEEYDVILEGERSQQRTISNIQNVYVKSQRTGEMIPISNLVNISEYGSAENLAHYNRTRAITLEANLQDGYTLGQGLAHLRKLVKDHLPETAIIDYKGQSYNFMNSGRSIVFVFLLGIAVVFLLLAAQFESFVHPFIIILTVPLSIGGGLLGLWLSGSSFNIYSQIGLIMLVGLATKNGILIVEFANQLRDKGVEFTQAIIEASEKRLRPILMTSLTAVAGAIPLVIGSGAGAETRMTIGVVVMVGVFVSTFFTIFLIPVAYSLVARSTKSPSHMKNQLEKEEKLSSSDLSL